MTPTPSFSILTPTQRLLPPPVVVALGAVLTWWLLCGLLPALPVALARADEPPVELLRPVPGEVLRPFDPPEHIGDSGHRGVDLQASPGTPVLAAAAGTVSHIGVIAGVPTISITHDPDTGLRTTYQPVNATVRVGDHVAAGHLVGTMAASPAHPGLHWGLLRGDEYLDPLQAMAADQPPPSTVQLLPLGAKPRPQPIMRFGPGLPEQFPGSTRPADGPITSGFGMRVHPILKTRRLHDGVDLGAPCGAPARSVQPGRVVVVERHPAYGIRVIVEHAGGLRTGYAHLGASRVGIGDPVAAGQRVGDVGSTGWSTGCHLHFMAWRGGQFIDPISLVR